MSEAEGINPTEAEEAEVPEVHRVLIVEDEDTLRIAESRILKLLGIEHETAVNGREALNVLGEKNPEGITDVMTDFDMPGMNGGELAKKIRERFPNMRITLMTGRPQDDEDITVLLELDPKIQTLQKPFGPEKIEEKLGIEKPQPRGGNK